MTPSVLDRLRAVCLALPDAVEVEGVGHPEFMVRGKIFAMRRAPQNGRESFWCKAPQGVQEVVVNADPALFFVPPYVGHHGWIGVWLDEDVDWAHIAALIEDSYRLTAGKRQIARMASGQDAPNGG